MKKLFLNLAINTCWLPLLALQPGVCGLGQAYAAITEVNVYTSGTEGYNIFRIPTIVKAANGDLLAFAEARSGGDASSIDIVVKRSVDSGATWGGLNVVMDNADFEQYFPSGNIPEVTVGNQSPVVDLLDPVHPGRIWMPFTLENDRVFVTYSDDNGASWAPQAEITSTAKDPSWGWYATGPVHGIQLERGDNAGRLIIPSDHSLSGVASSGAHVLYSDDHGQSWQLGAVETGITASSNTSPNENVAVELVDGRVYFNARDRNSANPGTRSVTYSSDGGLTYDGRFKHETGITSPVVQNSALRFRAVDQGDDQNIILYSGPSHPSKRVDLTIRASLDESANWTQETIIHSGPAAYSDLVKLNQDQFGVLFEAGDSLYDEILFATVDYSDLNPSVWNGIQGDVNQSGALDAADLPYFVSVWNPAPGVTYEGQEVSYLHGDLNFNGHNDLEDVFLMRQALLAAGIPPRALGALLQVPEPSAGISLGIFLFSITASLSRRRGKERQDRERHN
ncbi:sialidase family protein [Adhaeretor mobilis]|uniref:exo-alpha-sialidase n=1 Tax=Adhaeretor mobilis TaxID=1930276 RepID=A0A517MV96_9BACT|nr:sialidase family protein [Adhaeretor mobilis]QDS98813.1 Sialidase precursor [Adhaeretor mobilis]